MKDNMLTINIFLIFALAGTSFGQVIYVGSCPEVEVVQNFNASGYLGKWYEYARYFAVFEVAAKCSSAEYSLNSNGSVNVLNKAVSELSGVSEEIKGTANLVEAGKGQLDVYFPSQNSEANYYILSTDYENYAAVFSCKEIGIGLNARFAWLLTRSQNPSEDVVNKAKDAFTAQNISTESLNEVDQAGCQ